MYIKKIRHKAFILYWIYVLIADKNIWNLTEPKHVPIYAINNINKA